VFMSKGKRYTQEFKVEAAKRLLGRGLKEWEKPPTINTDKAPADGDAIR